MDAGTRRDRSTAHREPVQKVLAKFAGMVYRRVMHANRLAELRQKSDTTQAALAHQLGVTSSTVWRWEHGRVSIPDSQKAALALRFGVSIEHLMGWEQSGGMAA